jgi:hypothetical protein
MWFASYNGPERDKPESSIQDEQKLSNKLPSLGAQWWSMDLEVPVLAPKATM